MPRPLRQVCVTTLPEAEDAVSELLEQFFQAPATAYTNVLSGQTEVSVYLNKTSPWSAEIQSQLARGLQQLRHCGLQIGSAKVSASTLRTKDWADSWKKHFRPISIANRLLIKPSWSRRRAQPGQRVVVLDPGLSFGTGQHPTTRFCLQQLVAFRQRQRQSFLDLGTGSGILAITAARLGYAPVVALDIDPSSVRIARANALRNRAGTIRFRCQDLRRLAHNSKQQYSVICANLISNLLISERKRIIARLRRDGILIVAGILEEEFDEVQKWYEAEGLTRKKERVEGEWHSGSFCWRA